MPGAPQSPPNLEVAVDRPPVDPTATWTIGQRYGAALALGVLAALLNTVGVPLLSEETPEFLFGGALVLLAFVLLGVRPGLLAAGIALIPQVREILGSVPSLALAYLIYPLEALITYLLWRRTGSLVLATSLFWFGPGWILDALAYHWVVGVAWSYVALLLIKQVLNSLFNALLAELILRLPGVWRARPRAVELRQFVFGGVVSVVLIPGVLLAMLFARGTYQGHLDIARGQSELHATEVQLRVTNWLANYQQQLSQLARQVEAAPVAGAGAADTFPGVDALGGFRQKNPAILGLHLLANSTAGACQPTISTSDDATVITLRQPVLSGSGCSRELTLTAAGSELLPLLGGTGDEQVTLFDDRGRVLASQDSARAVASQIEGELSADASAERVWHRRHYPPPDSSVESKLGLDLRYATLTQLQTGAWTVLVDLPSANLHQAMTHSIAQLLFYFLALLTLLYSAVSSFASRVTGPIVAINRAALGIAEGHFEGTSGTGGQAQLAGLEAHPVAEVRSLAIHFAAMQHALAYRDMLTGLPNRRGFLELVGEMGERARSRPVALAQLGIDNYRGVAESLGQQSSARLSVAIARRLTTTAGESTLAARLGEDEFALVLPDAANPGDAVEWITSVLVALRRPFEIAGRQVTITASAGLLVHPGGPVEAEALLERAAAAMRAARQQGGDGLCLFSPEIDGRLRERQAIEQALREALAGGKVGAAFQPIVTVADGGVRGVEALARWSVPVLDDQGTERVIRLAEELDLVAAVDDAVLRVAAAAHAGWLVARPDLLLSVNLSPRRLHRPNLAEQVLRALEASGLPASRLEIEITESAVLLDFEQSLRTLSHLRGLGVRIALDDFGIGYSSLRYLQKLPVDTVKIDRSFVHNVDRAAGDSAIARAILAMAHSLGLEVVAEGVETAAQFEVLRSHGCDFVQGFWVSPPVPADEIPALLGRRLLGTP